MQDFSIAIGLIASVAAGVTLILTGNYLWAIWPVALSLALARNLYKTKEDGRGED